jgi:DNA topoisomerase I
MQTTFLNKHLTNCMPGLTAKVFRTFNASFTLEKELRKLDAASLSKMTPDEKVLAFNRANREVAILCNHQRTVNAKSHDSAMGKIQETIADLESQKEELEEALHGKKKKSSDKNDKKRKRDEDEDGGEDAPDAKKRKIPDDPEKIKKKIKEIDGRIAKWEVKKEEKEDLKTVALSTSKINYIDPRITIAWCKKNSVDIKKVFSKGVRDKFPWAFAEIDATPEYEF